MPPQYMVIRHRDERDELIRAFNHVQALWGAGKYFLSAPPEQNMPTVPVEAENEYNAFKVCGILNFRQF